MASNVLIYFTGQTPLLSGVMNNQTEVVKFLANNGADPNLQCKSFQFTPSLKKKDIGNSLNIICHVNICDFFSTIQQSLEQHGLKKRGFWSYTVFILAKKYTDLTKNLTDTLISYLV